MSAVSSQAPGAALDRLAEDIRQHHKQVERHANAMLAEAIAAGEGLLEAKRQLKHGEFGPFVAYCGISERSARVYMRLARHRGSAAVLGADSIRAALDAIAGPSRKPREQPDLGKPGASLAHGDWQRAAHEAALRTGRWAAHPYAPDWLTAQARGREVRRP